MDIDYIPWPADREDLIKVSVFAGDSPVSTHKHDFIEIVFIAQGTCLHRYHKTEVSLIPGDLFIVVPHEEHSYSIESATVIYNCMFYPEALGEDWKALKEISSIYDLLIVEPFYRQEHSHQEILHLSPSEVSYIEPVLNKMLEEQQNKQAGYQLILKAYLITLLTFLGRLWDKQFHNDWNSYNSKRDMLAQALNYIEQNMENDLRVNEIARRVYLSPDYFRRLFREVTGLTPIDYINKLRIARAERLLTGEDSTISEIAQTVGINDVNYFSRLFKSVTGQSPTGYRKKNGIY